MKICNSFLVLAFALMSNAAAIADELLGAVQGARAIARMAEKEGSNDSRQENRTVTGTFMMCRAMPLNSSDKDFKPDETEYELWPLREASDIGRFNSPEVVELDGSESARLAVKPRHGKLIYYPAISVNGGWWRYTPAPGFVGTDRVTFIVTGKRASLGDPVEFRLIYKLRVTREKLPAYIQQFDPPKLSVTDTYCPRRITRLAFDKGAPPAQP
jgi:hypothetical protein